MRISAGHCRQLGATPENDGVNFAIWARLASRVELLLFTSADDDTPEVIVALLLKSGNYLSSR